MPELTLKSPAFTQGGVIPTRFTCDGENLSPALAWDHPPAEAVAMALIMDDPDAPSGVFDHWVIYNIPPAASALPEGVPTDETLDNGAAQGRNSFGRLGYGGPCPPDKEHRYFFTLYALDATLDFDAPPDKQTLQQAMVGHILDTSQLMGRYDRPR